MTWQLTNDWIERVGTLPPSELIPAVVSLANVLLRESERLFRPHGVSAAQYNVLVALLPHPEGISQRQLSDVLVVDRSNVTGLINRMEKADWVKREDDPQDRRIYRVVLTARGRSLGQKLLDLYREAAVKVTRGITHAQAAEVIAVFQRIEARRSAWQ